MSARRTAPRDVDYEDVDDIIGIASEMENVASERLSVEDLESVAKDLEIPTEYVGPAIAELRRRRAAELAAAQMRKRRTRIALGVSGGVVVVFLLWVMIVGSNLSDLVSDAARQRAQVVNVMQRQSATEAQWRTAPASPNRDAELSGAENRVRIERKRYDDAAASYNADAAGFPGGLARGLYGLPATLPLSNEVGAW